MSNFTLYRVKNDEQTPIMLDSHDIKPGSFIENLRRDLDIKIISSTDDTLIFDLIGVDASIANALRRIMLAEVLFLKVLILFLIVR